MRGVGVNAPRRFFFYGTLLPQLGHPLARGIHARLRFLGAAHVRGALLAIPDPQGWYPALVAGEGRVEGALYAAASNFGPGELASMDRYEGCLPGATMRGAYRRVVVSARCNEGPCLDAQAYLYRHPLRTGAVAIAHGNFARWLEVTGARVFRGD